MSSILTGFEYDIFISYRHNDNLDGWVTDFVQNLEKELRATIKDPVSVYFDTNPHDGLLETHSVDKSLEGKLKCLIFIPIISQTYCDPKSFAWQHEFCAFNKLAKEDRFGRDTKLSNGNVASRILPVKIHEIDAEDKALIENELGGVLRSMEFIYHSAGVNRPLTPSDNPEKNLNKTFYRDQINKVANAVKEIIASLKHFDNHSPQPVSKAAPRRFRSTDPLIRRRTRKIIALTSVAVMAVLLAGYFIVHFTNLAAKFYPEPLDKSIAVLPFKNFSTNEETQYFADGVMEAVLNHLSKIKNLKVISRTSVEVYRKSAKTVREIANELGVNHILEGSVQRDGNSIRITVQLINADNDRHIWAENYDRELKDIFSIQSEIAENIAGQLKTTLNPKEKELIQAAHPYDMNAYDEFLKGRQKLVKFAINKDKDDLKTAVEFYHKAIEIDSSLAPAYAELANAYLLSDYSKDYLKENFLDTVLVLANKALRLDPNLSNGYRLRGVYYFNHNLSFKDAEAEVNHAIELDPNSADNYLSLGNIYSFYKQEKALESYLRGLRLDPNSASKTIIYSNISWIYISAGDFERSEMYARKALEIEPAYSDAHWCLVHAKVMQAKFKEALSLANEWLKLDKQALRSLAEIHTHLGNYKLAEQFLIEFEKVLPFDIDYKQRYGVVLWKLGRKKEATQKFEAVLKEYELMMRLDRPDNFGMLYDVAGVNAFLGRKEEAHKWLKKWEQYGLLYGLDHYALVDPLFENLWNDPDFKRIIKKLQDNNVLLAKKLKEVENKKI